MDEDEISGPDLSTLRLNNGAPASSQSASCGHHPNPFGRCALRNKRRLIDRTASAEVENVKLESSQRGAIEKACWQFSKRVRDRIRRILNSNAVSHKKNILPKPQNKQRSFIL